MTPNAVSHYGYGARVRPDEGGLTRSQRIRESLCNCAIDPKAGTESGHIGNLNPKSKIGAAGKSGA